MSQFDAAVKYVLKNEEGFVDHPHDNSSVTNFGISLCFLQNVFEEDRKKYGIFDSEITKETIKNLTMDQAKSIYKGEFWDRAPFQEIRNQEHVNYIFDMAVNFGISPAIKCVQRACWAVMKRLDLLPDDGILGNNTIHAIDMSGMFLMPALRAECGNFYRNIVDHNPEKKDFLKEWYRRTYNT